MAEATWTDLVRASGQAQLVGLCSASVGSETMGVSAWGWRPGQGTQTRQQSGHCVVAHQIRSQRLFLALPLCLYLLSGLGKLLFPSSVKQTLFVVMSISQDYTEDT